jgi:cardiolipin synthase
MIYIVLVLIYAFVALSIVLSLIINGVRPSKTLAWLLAIFTIPVGGVLLYLLVGRNRRKNKLLQLNKVNSKENKPPIIFDSLEIQKRHQKIVRLIQKSNHFNPSQGNTVVFLKDGGVTFTSIFNALEDAVDFIHFQYYIFEEGQLANKLLHIFQRKITQGVKIRLVYDGIGSFSLSKSYLKSLKEIGVEVFPFLPFKFGRFLRSVNYRNHRKIIVIDGTVAFTGGINISDKYLRGDTVLGKWHDMHLKIEGPAVADLDRVFLQDWQLVSEQEIQPVKQTIFKDIGNDSSIVQIVSTGPDDDFSTIEEVYFSMINSAEEYLYIVNPYVIPGAAILTALETAAMSGVDVRLLLSEKNDSQLVYWSVRSYFENLLRAGVKIYLFPEGFLHSKIVISDDEIASVGTANIDIRSFEQNYEVNAIIYNAKFTKALKRDFLEDSNQSTQIIFEVYLNRPWLDRLKEGMAKIFSPVL